MNSLQIKASLMLLFIWGNECILVVLDYGWSSHLNPMEVLYLKSSTCQCKKLPSHITRLVFLLKPLLHIVKVCECICYRETKHVDSYFLIILERGLHCTLLGWYVEATVVKSKQALDLSTFHMPLDTAWFRNRHNIYNILWPYTTLPSMMS